MLRVMPGLHSQIGWALSLGSEQCDEKGLGFDAYGSATSKTRRQSSTYQGVQGDEIGTSHEVMLRACNIRNECAPASCLQPSSRQGLMYGLAGIMLPVMSTACTEEARCSLAAMCSPSMCGPTLWVTFDIM